MEESSSIIIILTLMFFIILFVTCKDSFKNWEEATKVKGYPVPQGNLDNFKYGTTAKAQELMRQKWKNILNTSRPAVALPAEESQCEEFTPPMPNTIL